MDKSVAGGEGSTERWGSSEGYEGKTVFGDWLFGIWSVLLFVLCQLTIAYLIC